MTSLFENLKMKGGGDRKPGCPNDVHFKLHKTSKGKSQKHSILGMNLLTQPKIYEKVDLWIEWPAVPFSSSYPENERQEQYTNWIDSLIIFMNTFQTETIVLRFGYNPFSGSNWPPLTSTSTDYDNYYDEWIKRYPPYDLSGSNLYSIKQILDKTSVKTVYFLVQTASDDISGYRNGIHYLNHLLGQTGKWSYFNKVKTGICIEVEAFINNLDTTYTPDSSNANNVAKKISYLLKNYSGNLFTTNNIKTELGATNLTLDNDLVLAATGTQTQGKSINRISNSTTAPLIINRYFGQCYNMGSSLPQPPTTTQFNSQRNQSVINYLYDCVKLVDTDKSNYWAMLSLETDKIRKLNANNDGFKTPVTPISQQLGLLYQGQWKLFNELINQLKSSSTIAQRGAGWTNVNGFSGYFNGLCPSRNNCSSADPTTTYTDPTGTTTFNNIPLKNIMVFSSDFIEQISNPNADLEKGIDKPPKKSKLF